MHVLVCLCVYVRVNAVGVCMCLVGVWDVAGLFAWVSCSDLSVHESFYTHTHVLRSRVPQEEFKSVSGKLQATVKELMDTKADRKYVLVGTHVP